MKNLNKYLKSFTVAGGKLLIIFFAFTMIGSFDGFAQTAYMPNSGDNTVSVINVYTSNVLTTIPVGAAPIGSSVSPDGTTVYITNNGDNTVSVISTATNTVVNTIAVGAAPYGVCFSPDGVFAYVTNNNGNTVSVIGTGSQTVIAVVNVDTSPQGICCSTDGAYVYVPSWDNAAVDVISTATNTVSYILTVGTNPNGICITPDGTKLYVANRSSASVSVVNTVNNTVIATIPVGADPNGICVSPDGLNVYVASSLAWSVSVINTATNTVSATITTGFTHPEGIAATPDGSQVYVADYNNATVSVVNTATNIVVAQTAIGTSPYSFGNFISPHNPCAPLAEPGNITGAATVCNGTIHTYTIAAMTGATSYTWTLPNGWSGTSTTTSIVTTADSSGTISVIANDTCGSSVPRTWNVTVNFPPPPPGNIIGPDTICSGTSHTYSIPADNTATSYSWTLPGGWSGSSTTTSVNANAGSGGGTISVTAYNACGASVTTTLQITVLSAPVQIQIYGPNPVCRGSFAYYQDSILNGIATTYSWTLPNGWTGTSATNSIDATVGNIGGNILVTATNLCGTSSASLNNIIIDTARPALVIISGSHTICSGSSHEYRAIPQNSPADHYIWYLPTGWSGSSTVDSISVQPDAITGTIYATAGNVCGVSDIDSLLIHVITNPATPGPISGNTLVAINSHQTYTISSVTNASGYNWTFPSNWNITSGQGTTTVSVTVGSDTGQVCVTASNICGASGEQCLSIQIGSVTGINNNNDNGSVNIFPNPASTTLTLSITDLRFSRFNRDYDLRITDIMGREVYTQAVTNPNPDSIGTTIDVSQLNNGVYFYQVTIGTETYRGKFIKQ